MNEEDCFWLYLLSILFTILRPQSEVSWMMEMTVPNTSFFMYFVDFSPALSVLCQQAKKVLGCSKGCHMIFITNIHVNRMARMTGGGYRGVGKMWEFKGNVKRVNPWDFFLQPQYLSWCKYKFKLHYCYSFLFSFEQALLVFKQLYSCYRSSWSAWQ